MVRGALGLGMAFGAFAASFALHIVGGATDLGWLFAIAVGLIFLTATGFPAIALLIAKLDPQSRAGRGTGLTGMLAGTVLTAGALWAAADRTFLWWHPLAAAILVGVVSTALYAGVRTLGSRNAAPRQDTVTAAGR